MNLEETLRKFRLAAGVGALGERILAAARRARREQRLWRWTWVVAAAVLVIVVPVNRAIDAPRPVPAHPQVERELDEIAADEASRPRLRLALTPRQTSRIPQEVP